MFPIQLVAVGASKEALSGMSYAKMNAMNVQSTKASKNYVT